MWSSPARLAARIRALFRVSTFDRDFEEELTSHLAMLTEEYVRRGMPPEQARRAAALRLGSVGSHKQLHRDVRGLPALEALLQDARYAARTLRRDVGFTLFAVLIVGLGIGASTTIFSVVHAVLLRPLPLGDSDRLVWIANTGEDGLSGVTVPVFQFTQLRDQNRSFTDIGAYYAFYGVGDMTLTGHGAPERLSGVPVSRNFLPVLGVQPQLGRLFTAEECEGNGPKAVLLSDRLWRRRFAGDVSVIGRKLTLNDAPVTVVGVLPPSFDFGSVFAPGSRIDVLVPFALNEANNRLGNTLAMVGRLRPGVTPTQAQAEVTVLADQIRRRDPDRHFELKLSPLEEHVSGHTRPALLVLAGAVAAAMLIVCGNLANLLMARTATRHKEMAVRAALGAGRRRLIQQLLTESLILSCSGAAVGLACAVVGTRAVAHLDAFSIPLLETVRIDASTVTFTVIVAVLTGVVFGIVTALQSQALALPDGLKETSRNSSSGPRHVWIRDGLVVSEIALTCVLLVASGLLVRSFVRVLETNLGFRPERAAALRVDPGTRYTTQSQRNTYFDEALRRVRALPGIDAAGLTDVLPLGRNRSWSAGAKERERLYTRENPPPDSFVRVVSEGYLRAMGIPLRAGRDFNAHDTPSSKRVILVNETLARTLWPGQDPLGKTIVFVDPEREVVGVVADVRHLALEEGSGCEMYLPIRQTEDYASVDLVVRTALAPTTLASAMRTALAPLEPNLPLNEFRTLQQLVDKAVSPRRFVVVLLAGFATFAVILASAGIFAVVSYSVAQRRQELGIRMALGASPADLQARIVTRTLGLAAIGTALGALASWAIAHAMAALLFGVTPTDPATFAGMAVLLAAVAAAAAYVPARGVSRIDPCVALRVD